MNAAEVFLSDLLDALERHTQATQANTAAVNSLLGRKVLYEALPPAGRGEETLAEQLGQVEQLDQLCQAFTAALEELQTVRDRLEFLRQSLTIDQAPAAATGAPEVTP